MFFFKHKKNIDPHGDPKVLAYSLEWLEPRTTPAFLAIQDEA